MKVIAFVTFVVHPQNALILVNESHAVFEHMRRSRNWCGELPDKDLYEFIVVELILFIVQRHGVDVGQNYNKRQALSISPTHGHE
jgi:hypothetical protein